MATRSPDGGGDDLGDGSLVPHANLYDGDDGDDGDDGREAERPDPASLERIVARPRSYRDWLCQIDWPAMLPRLAAAERALARFQERWQRTPEAGAFRERQLLTEAVAQARISGMVTTRARILERLLLVDEAAAYSERYRPFLRIAPGDGLGVRSVVALRGAFDGAPPGPVELLTLGFDRGPGGAADPRDRPADRGDPEAEIEAERLSGYLREWEQEVARRLGRQPVSVRIAAGLWGLGSAGADRMGDPGTFGRLLAAGMLQGGRGGPPLFLGRAFMDQPTRWAPGATPERWLGRLLDGVVRAVELAEGDLALLESHSAAAAGLADGRRSTSRLAEVGQAIARREITTVPALRRELGWQITDRGLRKLIAELEARGMVHEITGRGRFRLYAHRSVGRQDLMIGPTSPTRPRVRPGTNAVERSSVRTENPGAAKAPEEVADLPDLDALIADVDRASSRVAALRRSTGASENTDPDGG